MKIVIWIFCIFIICLMINQEDTNYKPIKGVINNPSLASSPVEKVYDKPKFKHSESAAITVKEWISSGLIRNNQYSEYYIRPFTWSIFNITKKRNLLEYLIHHYASKGSDVIVCTLYDEMSGKKLGKYGAFGAKIY